MRRALRLALQRALIHEGENCVVVIGWFLPHSDSLNHSSIVEGVRGSGAKVQPFAHNNMLHLEAILERATSRGQPNGAPWRKIIIMVEGIYSMEVRRAHDPRTSPPPLPDPPSDAAGAPSVTHAAER